MKKILFLFITLFPIIISAQESLKGLHVNPVILHSKIKAGMLKNSIIHDTLPFIDDFSLEGIYPDQSRWTNNNVFINNAYCKDPVTVGVATFDALDADGQIYKNASFSQFSADTLTSIPLRLDTIFVKGKKSRAISTKDSLYFSFLYQPGGIGNPPESHDSLVLEFYSPADKKWHWIWSSAGTTFEKFIAHLDSGTYKNYKDSAASKKKIKPPFNRIDTLLHNRFNVDFKTVLLNIKDSALYYRKGFSFRFRSYASLATSYLPTWGAGNVDIWNIDYVYINTNRSIKDSNIVTDVAFSSKPLSFLKYYTSMPWKQFLSDASSEIISQLEYPYSNFFTIDRIVDQGFIITDLTKTFSPYKPTITTNPDMKLLSDTTFKQNVPAYVLTDNNKKNAVYEVKAYLKANIQGRDLNPFNDTVRFVQNFNNYFAYDDGIPEAGYGLNGSGGFIADHFNLSTTDLDDTLTSVAIFFNSTLDNINKLPFSLIVWDDNNGLPNNVIYKKDALFPVDSALDAFKVYHLDSAIILKNKSFFVGINQLTKDNLNIGFDQNNDNHLNQFYNTDGSWNVSIYPGALMIRPVFGKHLSEAVGYIKPSDDKLFIYPIPVNQNAYISYLTANRSLVDISIYDLTGKEVKAVLNETQEKALHNITVDMSDLKPGMYFLDININNHVLRKKLIKN